jgi:hypothetical protein
MVDHGQGWQDLQMAGWVCRVAPFRAKQVAAHSVRAVSMAYLSTAP